MARAASPRLPIDPLLRLCDGNVGLLAEALRRPRRVITRWKTLGLPLVQADRCAVAVGHHPVDLWPDWYEATEAWATHRSRRCRAA